MLSGAPAVSDVNVSSTDCSSEFVDYLESSSLGKDGLIVDTVLSVDAPVISDFSGETDGEGFWTFTGTVTDGDDDPTGWVVTFGGVLNGHYAVVQEDGSFAYSVYLESAWGDCWAQTEDDHGAESNVPVFFVTPRT